MVVINSNIQNIIDIYDLASPGQLEAGQTWYDTALDQCHELAIIHGLDVETVVGVVAALSPRTQWSVNIRFAHEVILGNYKGKLSANVEKAVRIIEGVDVLAGPKVTNFKRNILGDKLSVTVDTWAYRISRDTSETKTINEKLYAEVAEDYIEAARLIGISPRELQAITWVTYRDLVSSKGKKRPGQISLL